MKWHTKSSSTTSTLWGKARTAEQGQQRCPRPALPLHSSTKVPLALALPQEPAQLGGAPVAAPRAAAPSTRKRRGKFNVQRDGTATEEVASDKELSAAGARATAEKEAATRPSAPCSRNKGAA
eukprot:UN4067